MIVKNVRFVKGRVEIETDETNFFMSKENYIDNPITIDSFIDEEKMNYLLDQEKVISTKISLIKLLNRKMLTEQEIRNIIKENGVTGEDIGLIINSLSRAGLINDEYVCICNIESLLLKKKGKLEIFKKLKDRGIKYSVIDKEIASIDEEVYRNNFTKVYEKYEKMYEKKAFKVKEKMITNKLREYGYEEELILTLNIKKNNQDELELAKAYLIKMLKNKKIDVNDYENLKKIKTKLVMKGFSYDIINLALEEVEVDGTY